MKLSHELRVFVFMKHDDPAADLEILAQKAKTLEAIATVHAIVSDFLGQAFIDEILKQHVNRLDQAGYKSDKFSKINHELFFLAQNRTKKESSVDGATNDPKEK